MDLFSCFSHFRNKKKVKARIYMNRFCSTINLSSFIIACFKPQNIQLHVGKHLSEGNLCAISIEGKDSYGPGYELAIINDSNETNQLSKMMKRNAHRSSMK